MVKNYEGFKKNLEQLKKQYKGVWTLFVPRDTDAEVGDVVDNFESYYYLTLRRPSIFEFEHYIKHLTSEDYVSACELILNSCMIDGNAEVKDDDTYFLPLIYNTSFTHDLEKSMGVRKVYLNTKTLDVWVSKYILDTELTQEYCENNADSFDHFAFKKVGRNDLRDSSVFSSVRSQQTMLNKLCSTDNAQLIFDDEIFYSLYYSKILNFMFNTKSSYLKKN